MKTKLFLIIFILVTIFSCSSESKRDIEPIATESSYFTWDNATTYFLLTDRFNNGNKENDGQHADDASPAPYRGFMGGDIVGVTQKIKEGYFDKLGVNAIWTTPVLEQIKGSVDEGTGISYPFHGYWTRDWTSFDNRFGTENDFAEFVQVAHEHGIRVIMDVIVNHTGPVTPVDSKWPEEWVRTGPRCQYKSAESTITCTLVDNLPDIKTESNNVVELPDFLVKKWKKEGRYEQETKELDEFFSLTGYPRAPRYYIIKWLVDYIKKFGIDGFRVDTVKHTEEEVWTDLMKEAQKAFNLWKKENQSAVLDDQPFYMVGEVYNYYISGGREFDYGDKKVDFYKDAFHALINFDFKGDANHDYETIFTKYNQLLHHELKGKSVVNYVSSHDDGGPFDLDRKQPISAGTKLLLCPGSVQIYYGDESARSLTVEAKGDATLRSFMNWDEINNNKEINGFKTKEILEHWRKLGSFRNNHPSIGAGNHKRITSSPYVFQRNYRDKAFEDHVVIGLDLSTGAKTISVGDVFSNGTVLIDYYSGKTTTVNNGKISIETKYNILLLEKK